MISLCRRHDFIIRKVCRFSHLAWFYRFPSSTANAPNRAVPLCRLCRHLPFTEGESTPSPKGRLTDTEAVSFSLLLLLARSATHAEGVTLFCPLFTVHEKRYLTGGRQAPSPTMYQFLFNKNIWDDGLILF